MMNTIRRPMHLTLNLVRLGQFSPLPTGMRPTAAKNSIDASRAKLAAVKNWLSAVGKNNVSSLLSAADSKEFLTLFEAVEKDSPAIDHIYGQVAAGPWVESLGYVEQPLVDDITEWGTQVERLHALMTLGMTAEAARLKTGNTASPAGVTPGTIAPLPAGGIGTKELLIGSGAALGLGTLVYFLFKG